MSLKSDAFYAATRCVLAMRNLGRDNRGAMSEFAVVENRKRIRECIYAVLPDDVLDILTSPYVRPYSAPYTAIRDAIGFVIDRAMLTLPNGTHGRRKHSARRSFRRYARRHAWTIPYWLYGPKESQERRHASVHYAHAALYGEVSRSTEEPACIS